MAVVAVAVRHLRSHEAEVHRGSHRSQRMIGPHAPIQIHLITEKLLLTLVPSHHIAGVRRNQTLAVQSPPDLGNRPSRHDVFSALRRGRDLFDLYWALTNAKPAVD